MTMRSTSGNSLSLCQTTAGGRPQMLVSAAIMSRSRLSPGKTTTADFMRGVVVSLATKRNPSAGRIPAKAGMPTAATLLRRDRVGRHVAAAALGAGDVGPGGAGEQELAAPGLLDQQVEADRAQDGDDHHEEARQGDVADQAE